MFEDIKNEMLEKCYKEVVNRPSKKLENVINKLKKEVSLKDFEKGIRSIVQFTMGQSIMLKLDEKEIEKVYIQSVKNLLEQLPELRRSYLFSVELLGLEKQLNRTIEVSASMNLADLCYLILATVESQASHLFQIEYQKVRYECDVSEDDGYYDVPFIYASSMNLAEMGLRKGSQMTLLYDLGDNFYFNIKLIEIKNNQTILSMEDVKVISGYGYGIWEDSHYEMELYYCDPKGFTKYIKDNQLDKDFFPINQEFDIDFLNKSLLEKFYSIKKAYKYDENL